MPESTAKDLRRILGRELADPPLYRQALTHASFSHEASGRVPHNERLEFLGDAVLGLVVAEELFRRFPDREEGDLTRLRASLVSGTALADAARRMGLGAHLWLGRGEDISGGRDRDSVLSGALEALVAALYLTEGLPAVRDFLKTHLLPERLQAESGHGLSESKSRLQEWVQQRWGQEPVYRLVEESGPDHQKRFTVEVSILGKTVGRGEGGTKKEAEQRAAFAALRFCQNNFAGI